MTRVWLPESPASFGPLPPGIEADVWDGVGDLPESADQVEFVVLPLDVSTEALVIPPDRRRVGAPHAGVIAGQAGKRQRRPPFRLGKIEQITPDSPALELSRVKSGDIRPG